MRKELSEAIKTQLEPYFDNVEFREPLWEKVTKFPVLMILYDHDDTTLYVNNKVNHKMNFKIYYVDKRLSEKSEQAEWDALDAIEFIRSTLDWKHFNVKIDGVNIVVLGRIVSDNLTRSLIGNSGMYYTLIGDIDYTCEFIVPTDMRI